MFLTSLFVFGSTSCHSQESKTMNIAIKNTIENFVKAGEDQNPDLYQGILHSEFQVIANRYPTPDKVSIISNEGYVGLITNGVIGGNKYEVDFLSIHETLHSATVIVELKGKNGGQIITFLLIKNLEGSWQIICNLATQTIGR